MLYTIHDNNKKLISINQSILETDNIIINNEILSNNDTLSSNNILSNKDSLSTNEILIDIENNTQTMDIENNTQTMDIENNRQSIDKLLNNRRSSSISSLNDSYHLSDDENSEISMFSYFNVGKELLKNQNNEKNK